MVKKGLTTDDPIQEGFNDWFTWIAKVVLLSLGPLVVLGMVFSNEIASHLSYLWHH